VWATLIVPVRKKRERLVERLSAKWHENDARAFVLETQNEALNDRDTAVLTNGAETRCDPFAVTPVLEHITPERLALVADDVFGRATRVIDGALEEALNRHGCGIVPEGCDTCLTGWLQSHLA
jgi:hypothetical protein